MMPHLVEACSKCRMCNLGWSKASKHGIKKDPHVFSNYSHFIKPPRFMIIGQNPGWNEVKQGIPFVGDAGKNFDDALLSTPWSRDDFYITNIVKCFSKGNKKPSIRSVNRCEPFLKMEIAIIKPILVIAFGSVSFSALCDGKFSNNIGRITNSTKFDVKVFTTYHPSPLNLTNKSREKQFRHDIMMLGKIMVKYLSPF